MVSQIVEFHFHSFLPARIYQTFHLSPPRLDSLKHSGVAGMKEFTGVKCLHTHYAHHLARPEHGNIIGVWVHELLLLKEQENANPV